MNAPRVPDISINLNLKAILGTLAMLSPLVVGLTLVLKAQQDIRSLTLGQITIQQDIRDLRERMTAQEKAKLTYCISRAADSVAQKNSPDANC